MCVCVCVCVCVWRACVRVCMCGCVNVEFEKLKIDYPMKDSYKLFNQTFYKIFSSNLWGC